uniref:Sugar transporter SWEET1 n=1 Tax=Anolis carolinensis TaxID=28377 RepID=A0A803T0K2_ANOCA
MAMLPNALPCPQGSVLWRTLALLGALLLGYGYFSLLVPDRPTRLSRLGLFCSLFTIAMYLSRLADVIQNDSASSFPLTVTTFLASASWTLYGLLLGDPYIAVPNVPGIATSLVRFWLFWRFPPDLNKTLYRPLQA